MNKKKTEGCDKNFQSNFHYHHFLAYSYTSEVVPLENLQSEVLQTYKDLWRLEGEIKRYETWKERQNGDLGFIFYNLGFIFYNLSNH